MQTTEPLLVVREWEATGIPAGRLAVVNAYPPSDRVNPSFWDISTDFDHLLSQTLRFTARDNAPELCPDGAVGVYNSFVELDYNCNGVDAADEGTVDVSDPMCAANVDPNGDPYTSADYYYDYGTFGCLIFMPPYDLDGDGLGEGVVTLERPDNSSLPWGCSNCVTTAQKSTTLSSWMGIAMGPVICVMPASSFPTMERTSTKTAGAMPATIVRTFPTMIRATSMEMTLAMCATTARRCPTTSGMKTGMASETPVTTAPHRPILFPTSSPIG